MASDQFVFLPLGGVGEIGMNLALYGFGSGRDLDWIMVDCGVTFPGPDLPGVDLVLPDTGFIEARLDRLRGIVITHAHEDHYGALMTLWPRLRKPLYMTPFAAGMLESKRQSNGGEAIPVTIFQPGEGFDLGPFSISSICVTHSIPEPVSLAIKSPLGTAIHTADWKIDTEPTLGPLTDQKSFQNLGDEGVLALICDSTNAMREGESPSEMSVSQSLRSVIEGAEGRVVITTFSSNVGRIRSIAQAAAEAGRSVLVLGRSIERVVDVAIENGYLDGLPDFLTRSDFGSIPRRNLVVICTGSQGETRAALAKLSRDEMRHMALAAGDTVVFSSRTIPGNEKPVLNIKNGLIDRGIEIVEDGEELVHVSGHPRRSELLKMYGWTRPQILVPVHGEPAHLVAQAKLGRDAGIPKVMEIRNGMMLRLAPGKPDIIDDVPAGEVYRDGNIVGNFQDLKIADRKRLAMVGHVGVLLSIDRDCLLKSDPEVSLIGLPQTDGDGEEMEDVVYDAVLDAHENLPRQKRKDLATVRETVRRSVRNAVDDAWGKKPIVTVFLAHETRGR